MINLQGKRNSAIIFTDKLDKAAKTQIAALLREEAYADSKIRIMPDTHAGKGAAVGTTMTLSGRVSPSLVGVDIGCGMEVVFLKEREVDLPALDQVIHTCIPSGGRIHPSPKATFPLETLHCFQAVDRTRALLSLGTLGGGNHFIELDKTANGALVLVIHSGSRMLGSDVATYYGDQAYRYWCKKLRKREKQRRYDEDGEGFRSRNSKPREGIKVSRETAVLEGELFETYLRDLETVTAFADLNRRTMAELICKELGLTVARRFSCVHNTIDTRRNLLRKGAISANLGEEVIIPLNMRDGAILGVGLGNPHWNYSAPHGAGRICTREEAQYAFSLEDFQAQMQGIYTTTAQKGSIDECPMAYKPPERILSAIGDTVSVTEIIKPVYNYKHC